MTSSTPLNPRSARERRKDLPEGFGFGRTDGQPQHLTASLRVGAGGDYHGDIDDAATLADPHIGGVNPHIPPLTFDRPGEEGVDAFVNIANEAGHLAPGDAFHAHGLHSASPSQGRAILPADWPQSRTKQEYSNGDRQARTGATILAVHLRLASEHRSAGCANCMLAVRAMDRPSRRHGAPLT
jgi:hypothetical protein